MSDKANDYIEPTDYIEDEILLTLDQVKQWEARHAEICRELERLHAEGNDLSRKLAAARVLGFLAGDDNG